MVPAKPGSSADAREYAVITREFVSKKPLDLPRCCNPSPFSLKCVGSKGVDLITTEFKAPPRLASSRDGDAPEISVFLPVFNEEPNLRPLHEKLDSSLAQLGRSAEIIY